MTHLLQLLDLTLSAAFKNYKKRTFTYILSEGNGGFKEWPCMRCNEN